MRSFNLKILQKYVLRELIGPGLLGLIIFTFLIFIKELFSLTDILFAKGVESNLVFKLIIYLLPTILKFTIPMALLISVLLTFGRLSADREIMVMRTCGLNLFHLFLPVIIISILLSFLLFYIDFNFIPNLIYKMRNIQYQIAYKIISNFEPRKYYDDFSVSNTDTIIYFKDRDPKTGEMLGISILNKKEEKEDKKGKKKSNDTTENIETPLRILAQRAQVFPDMKKDIVTIKLFNGSIQTIRDVKSSSEGPGVSNRDKAKEDTKVQKEREYVVSFFDEVEKEINPGITKRDKYGRYKKGRKEMTFNELESAIKASSSEKKANELIVEKYRRIVIPFSCIAFVLIGIPFGIMVKPTGKSTGFGITFILVFAYYVIVQFASAAGEEGNPLTLLYIWLPNIGMAIIGSILLYKTINK